MQCDVCSVRVAHGTQDGGVPFLPFSFTCLCSRDCMLYSGVIRRALSEEADVEGVTSRALLYEKENLSLFCLLLRGMTLPLRIERFLHLEQVLEDLYLL